MISDSERTILDISTEPNPTPVADRPSINVVREPESTHPRLAAHLGTQLVTGRMEGAGRRISDMLNDNTLTHVVMREACSGDLGRADRPVEGGILSVRKDFIDFVVPWDDLDLYRPRVRTQPVATEVTTRFFRVRGGLSRRATDPTSLMQLLSGYARRFIPVADATIESLLDPGYQLSAPIILINTGQIHTWFPLSDS